MNNTCNKSVLIIDDDARMLRALEKALAGEGYKVTCATLVAEAIEILTQRKTPVDLVITDLQMPFMTGVLTGMTMVYAIHQIFPALPVIVLTAFGSPDVKAECLRQGVAAFLEKPLDTPHLLNTIEGVCPGRRGGMSALAWGKGEILDAGQGRVPFS